MQDDVLQRLQFPDFSKENEFIFIRVANNIPLGAEFSQFLPPNLIKQENY